MLCLLRLKACCTVYRFLARHNVRLDVSASVQGIEAMVDPRSHRLGDQYGVQYHCLMWTLGVAEDYAAHVTYGKPLRAHAMGRHPMAFHAMNRHTTACHIFPDQRYHQMAKLNLVTLFAAVSSYAHMKCLGRSTNFISRQLRCIDASSHTLQHWLPSQGRGRIVIHTL